MRTILGLIGAALVVTHVSAQEPVTLDGVAIEVTRLWQENGWTEVVMSVHNTTERHLKVAGVGCTFFDKAGKAVAHAGENVRDVQANMIVSGQASEKIDGIASAQCRPVSLMWKD